MTARLEFDTAFNQVLQHFGENTVGAQAVRHGVNVITEQNKELLTALEGLCGLAALRPGHLYEYKAAVEEAKAIIAKAKGMSQ